MGTTAALGSGIKAVAAAATAEPLVASSTLAKWVQIKAHDPNTGLVFVGDSNVVAATGDTARGIFVPEQIAVQDAVVIMGPLDLADVYLDVTISGDSASFVYQAFN